MQILFDKEIQEIVIQIIQYRVYLDIFSINSQQVILKNFNFYI